jgi:exo-beta-1,3-glucanase (GH17 family)
MTAAPSTDAPALALSTVPGKNHLVLTWTGDPNDCSYEIHRSTIPYFAPGLSTLQTTVQADVKTYTDYCAARNVDLNYFYIVRAIACSTGEIADSNPVGEFDFPLEAEGETEPMYRLHGLNFSPYIADDEDPDRGGHQITDEELADRLTLIAPYTRWIRTFGCGNDLQEAGRFVHTMGLKAAVGAWLGSEATAAGQQANRDQVDCLKEQARAGHVDIAIVGSEVLLRNDLSESRLIDYINEVKLYFQAEGIQVPVTYADVYGVLLQHPNIISAVDLVMPNYYPYWEGKKLDYAVAYLHRWRQQIVSASGGKEVVVSETGWPSCGNQIGEAVPSIENASYYFLNFVSWARATAVQYFYFEAYDEGWKVKHEGPQGACWGIWDKYGRLKPGMQRVINGETVPDNWTQPVSGTPIIDFLTLPTSTQTNLPTFVVASFSEPGNEVVLNGVDIPAESMDEEGNFAVAVPLSEGDNLLALTIRTGEEVVMSVNKHVFYGPSFATGSERLVYVDSVVSGPGVPALPGTIVIAPDRNTILGLIEDKHVVGISPDGRELYMSDRTVISTDTHQPLRTLAFTYDIPSNGFLVSPDGTRLYSRNERLDVQANILLENLPLSIVSGSSWAGAPIPGGPAISSDGRRIYCCNNLQVIDTADNTVVSPPISSYYLSDIALTPDDSRILITSYSWANGVLSAYNAATFEQTGSIGGLGDFVGEIGFSKDGQKAIVGSAGNPAWAADGRVTIVDLSTFGSISRKLVPLADNLTASANNELFVSTGENGVFRRQGIDVYVLDAAGNLERVKSFFLGINRFRAATGAPQNDQIRKIIFKP